MILLEIFDLSKSKTFIMSSMCFFMFSAVCAPSIGIMLRTNISRSKKLSIVHAAIAIKSMLALFVHRSTTIDKESHLESRNFSEPP